MKKLFILFFVMMMSITLLSCSSNQTEPNVMNTMFHDGLLGICNREGECGYFNEDFEIEIPLEYNYVANFNQGIALVEYHSRCGVINTANEIIIPTEYENASFNYEYELIKLLKDDVYYYFDFDGNELTYREAHEKQGFSEDTLFVYSRKYRFTTTGGYETIYGFKDIDGNIVIEAEYDSTYEYYFTDSTIVKDGYNYVALSNDGTTSPSIGKRINYSFYDGYITFQANSDLWGITDFSGNITVDPEYMDLITLNENGIGPIRTEDDLFGLVKYDGTFIVNPTFDCIGGSFEAKKYAETGFIIFFDETTHYLYNEKGELVYDSEEIIYDMFQEYIIIRDKETYDYIIIDSKGKEIISDFESYNSTLDNDYIFIERVNNGNIERTIYDKNLNLIDINFDFIPHAGYTIDNRTDKDFLSIRDYDTDTLYLYNDKGDLIKSFGSNYLLLSMDVIIFSDGYIVYYEQDGTLIILNHDGVEIFGSDDYMYLTRSEYTYLWKH